MSNANSGSEKNVNRSSSNVKVTDRIVELLVALVASVLSVIYAPLDGWGYSLCFVSGGLVAFTAGRLLVVLKR
jgi:hypothetical protein